MHELTFWKNWKPAWRRLLLMLLVLCFGSILYFVYSLLNGPDSVISWQSGLRTELFPMLMPAYENPFLRLPVALNGLLVFESFGGSALQVNVTAAYIMLGLLVLGLSIVLAVLTALPRFWYLAGITLFGALLVSMQLDQLQLFGQIGGIGLGIAFLLFLPLSYWLNEFNRSWSIVARAAAFLLAFAVFGVVVFAFAEVSHPFLYLANYGMPGFLVLLVLIVVLVAGEPIAAIMYLVTAQSGPQSRHNVRHFLIISGLYLLNLLLYYLEVRNVLDLDLLLISPFWILLISLGLAFWTLQFRFKEEDEVLPYQPLGVLAYLGLVIIVLAIGGYVFAADNSPWIETLEDIILYTHLGFGVALVAYLLLNFYALLRLNKPVYRVMYQPQYMPLFSARLLGLIAVVGLFSMHGSYVFYQPMAGYYNSVGDLYLVDGNYLLAREYYKLGSQFKARNHRSNYALASLAVQNQEDKAAIFYLKAATEYNPSPFSYANLANLYAQRNMFFDALFTLQEGVKEFPDEGRLRNNLGLLYARTGLVDSALYYLQTAEGLGEVPEANAAAMLAKKGLQYPVDSLLNSLEGKTDAVKANMLALAGVQSEESRWSSWPPLPEPSSRLEPNQIAWLLNASLAAPPAPQTWGQQAIAAADSAQSGLYEEQLSLAAAEAAYKSGQVGYAFFRMKDLADRSLFNQAAYAAQLGNWAMEQQAPGLAARYFGRAASLGLSKAALLQAAAYLQAQQQEEAAAVLLGLPDSLLDQEVSKSKQHMLFLLDEQQKLPDSAADRLLEYRSLWVQGARLPFEERQRRLARIQQVEQRNHLLQAWLPSWRLQEDTMAMQAALRQLSAMQRMLSGRNKAQAAIAATRTALQLQQEVPEEVLPNLPYWWQEVVELYQQPLSEEKALAFAELALQNPYASEVVLRAADKLTSLDLQEKAYKLVANAHQLNATDPYLKEGYVRYAMAMGLDNYALEVLQEVEALLPEKRFFRLKTEVEKVQAARTTNWQ